MAEPRQVAAEAAQTLLKVGEGAARTFAEAVTGRPQPGVAGEQPLAAIVRHATSGLAGLTRVVIDAVRNDAAPRPASAPSPAPAPNFPTISAGSVLRVPLSIDNPGETAMDDLAPAVLDATCDGHETAPPPIRFTPARLSIAPRDFEKLVLEIAVPADARPGQWALRFSPDGTADGATAIRFVVSPEQGPERGPAPSA